ncbi:MAG: SPASM domain-containing protein [Magnetococcales bacterium]|nr:SPASM domain-containing protein [Magnetococcales bacterium]
MVIRRVESVMDDRKEQSMATVVARIDSTRKVALEEVVPLSTPFSAHIDVCSVCNFKCSFCFQADNAGMKAANLKRGMMPMALFRKIVDDLAQFDTKMKKVKIGNHGEPTLHPDLPEMIGYVRDRNIAQTIELFTNASKLEPILNERLVDAGLQQINISLEGLTSERYKEVAGVAMDMERLVENIRHLYTIRRQCRIYIKIVDQTSSLSPDKDVPHVMSESERRQFFETYSGICDEIYVEKVVPQWARTQFEKQNKVGSEGMYGQKIRSYKEICPFVFMYLHFNWDGTTSPCTLDWPKKVVIGNVYQQSVHEIWNGLRLRQLQQMMLDGQRHRVDFCNDCSAPMVCCNEDLDEHAASIEKRLVRLSDSEKQENPWRISSERSATIITQP